MAKEHEEEWEGIRFEEGQDPIADLDEFQKQRRRLLALAFAGILGIPSAGIVGELRGEEVTQGADRRKQATQEREQVGVSVERAYQTARLVVGFLDTDQVEAQARFDVQLRSQTAAVTKGLYNAVAHQQPIYDVANAVTEAIGGIATLEQQVFSYFILSPLLTAAMEVAGNTAGIAPVAYTDGMMRTVYASALASGNDVLQRETEVQLLEQQLTGLAARGVGPIAPRWMLPRDRLQSGISGLITQNVLLPALGPGQLPVPR